MIPSYPDVLGEVKRVGRVQKSQHGATTEVMLLQVISSPGEMVRRDNINYSIGYMEALQLIAGIYNIDAMVKVAPNASHVLFTLPMAYGPRIATQMPRIIEKLRQDPDTRQAVVFIGKPEDGATNDQPCTTLVQFLIRQGEVTAIVSMRSWDLIKGLPYDLMMFHALNAAVAHCLGVRVGHVVVTAGSGHIYDRDMHRQARESSGRTFTLAGDLPMEWKDLQAIAQGQVLATDEWNTAERMRHVIPPLFVETYTPVESTGSSGFGQLSFV